MTNRQLAILIALVTLLSLTLAWTIERAQVRSFMQGFEKWWEEKSGSAGTD